MVLGCWTVSVWELPKCRWVLTSFFSLPRFLLMMGVLFCCGAGFFIRRRMYPPPLVEEPTFNVSYTRQPVNTASGQKTSIKQISLMSYICQGIEKNMFFWGEGVCILRTGGFWIGIALHWTTQSPPVMNEVLPSKWHRSAAVHNSIYETQDSWTLSSLLLWFLVSLQQCPREWKENSECSLCSVDEMIDTPNQQWYFFKFLHVRNLKKKKSFKYH